MDITLFLSLVVLVFFVFMFVFAMKQHFVSAFVMMAMLILSTIVSVEYKENKDITGLYFYPCEIVAQNEQSTYFAQIDSENAPVYCCNTNPEWDANEVYLLHMDGNGTKDKSDDKVLVVWRQ